MGTVSPVAARPHILAIRSSSIVPDTVTTSTDALGACQLGGLPAGTHRVEYFPSTTAPAGQPAYGIVVRTGITVVNDQLTPLGNTSLNQIINPSD